MEPTGCGWWASPRAVRGTSWGNTSRRWGGRSVSTVDVYGTILHPLAGQVSESPGGSGGLRPELFAWTAVETCPKKFEAHGYGVSQRFRAKSVASGFAGWLIEGKGLLRKNPMRFVEVPAQALLAPGRLSRPTSAT